MIDHRDGSGAERVWRLAIVIGLLVLIVALCGWAISSRSWQIGILIVPLLIILPGIGRAQLYTYRIASLLLIAYMLLGIVESFGITAQRLWAVAVLSVSSCIFVAVLGYVRARRQN